MVKAITYILENNATVQGIVGQNNAGDKYKIYPVVVPQSETEPYVVVRQTNRVATGKGCNSYDYTFEVLSYHPSYDDATDLGNAVISAIQSQASGSVNGVAYAFSNLTNEADSFSADHGNSYVKLATFFGQAD